MSRAAARALRREGYSYAAIATDLGVSTSTAFRWINPDFEQRMRRASRAAKARRTGTCRVCGGTTRYAGTPGRPVSDLCSPCSIAAQKAAAIWTRDTIIGAIQAWANEHGQPPTAAQWNNGGPGHPPKSNVYAPGGPFPTWADAIEAAGFPRPVRGRPRYARRAA